MTSEQKKKVDCMRSQRFIYKEIAKETGLSESTIKSYFHRTKKPETESVEKQITETEDPSAPVLYKPCHFCGEPVAQNPGRREKKFCSDSCRMLWWNRNKYIVPRKSSRIFICQSCGSEFYSYGVTDRKYCSHACYIHERFHGGTVCE